MNQSDFYLLLNQSYWLLNLILKQMSKTNIKVDLTPLKILQNYEVNFELQNGSKTLS